MKYLILVIDALADSATPNEMVEIDSFNEKLQNNGNWIFAWGLHGPEHSLLIDNRSNAGIVENQSLVSTNENYSGFWLIEAKDKLHAEQLAKEGSMACNRKVELRPLH